MIMNLLHDAANDSACSASEHDSDWPGGGGHPQAASEMASYQSSTRRFHDTNATHSESGWQIMS
jgi:hypothetical protein